MKNEKGVLYHECNRELRHTLRAHHAICDGRVRSLGIHPSQHMLLMHLSLREEIASQKELAEHMHISPAALAVSLGKLESGGYIAKEVSGSDSRVKTLAITEKGRALVSDSKCIFDRIDREMFAGVSDEEASLFWDVLKRLHKNLDRMKENEEQK